MTRAIETQVADISHGKTTDRPPLGRFFLLFCGLIALALGLSALSAYGAATEVNAPAVGESRNSASPEPAQRASGA
jgi:hypothetical protein